MPLHGYTRMFERMLDHPNIHILLNSDYREIKTLIPHRELIYTGPVDEYFEYCFGKLPYRSLRFEWETRDVATAQPAPVINYPNDHLYTRVTEFKYLSGQEHPKTTLVYEFPTDEGDPYYPVPTAANAALYAKYQALAEATPEVRFLGRLGTYKYYNMDQVVAQALALYSRSRRCTTPRNCGLTCYRTSRRRRRRRFKSGAGLNAPSIGFAAATAIRSSVPGHGERLDDLDRFAESRRQRAALPGIVGARRAGLARSVRLDVDRCAAVADGRARTAPNRRAVASRQRPAATPRCSTRSFRICSRAYARIGGGAIPVGRRLYADQRAIDDGAVQRAVWHLVPARPMRSGLCPRLAQSSARHRPGDGRHPRRQP